MDTRGMRTWGRRGFAAAAITGGMIGISGTGALAVTPPAGGQRTPDAPGPRPVDPTVPPAGPGVEHTAGQPGQFGYDTGYGVGYDSARYGVPDYQARYRSSEYQLTELDAERPGRDSLQLVQPYGAPGSQQPRSHGAPTAEAVRPSWEGAHSAPSGAPAGTLPRHGAPEYGQPNTYRDPLGGHTGGLPSVSSAHPAHPAHPVQPMEPRSSTHSGPIAPVLPLHQAPSGGHTDGHTESRPNPLDTPASGSDGFLAGNLAALAAAPMGGGSAIGTLGSSDAGLSSGVNTGLNTGFDAYGSAPAAPARANRHAKPEPADELYSQRRYDEEYPEPRRGGSRRVGAHAAPQLPEPGPLHIAETATGQHAAPASVDSETSALAAWTAADSSARCPPGSVSPQPVPP